MLELVEPFFIIVGFRLDVETQDPSDTSARNFSISRSYVIRPCSWPKSGIGACGGHGSRRPGQL